MRRRSVVLLLLFAAALAAPVILTTALAPKLSDLEPAGDLHARARLQAALVAIHVQRRLEVSAPSEFDTFRLEAILKAPDPTAEPDDLIDPWGHPFGLRKYEYPRFAIVSYGADGKPGGRGPDQDVIVDGPRSDPPSMR